MGERFDNFFDVVKKRFNGYNNNDDSERETVKCPRCQSLILLDRYEELTALLSDPAVISDVAKMTKLSKEQSDLEPIKSASDKYLGILKSIEENKVLLEDAELGELAKDELKTLEDERVKTEEELKILLIPKDPNDEKNIFLEKNFQNFIKM